MRWRAAWPRCIRRCVEPPAFGLWRDRLLGTCQYSCQRAGRARVCSHALPQCLRTAFQLARLLHLLCLVHEYHPHRVAVLLRRVSHDWLTRKPRRALRVCEVPLDDLLPRLSPRLAHRVHLLARSDGRGRRPTRAASRTPRLRDGRGAAARAVTSFNHQRSRQRLLRHAVSHLQ